MKLFNTPDLTRWQEPAMLQRLRHKYIVRYVSYSHVADESAQLIMEFVDGQNLQEVLSSKNVDGQLSKAQARAVLRQLLEATEYFHSMKVTHRDIKPANIILVSRNPIQIKVVDFGFATDMSSFKSFHGTPLFLAPEMLSMQRQLLTNKVDIFAIGVVAMLLFRISADLVEINGPQDYVRTVRQHRQLIAASGSLQPSLLTPFDLILDLLSERPEDRPSAKQCLSHPFFQRENVLETAHGSQIEGVVADQTTTHDGKDDGNPKDLGTVGRKRRIPESPVREEQLTKPNFRRRKYTT
ncbi:hypothetical protein SEPCBS119000_005505 [Sporothrix epigloea]|uniref:Protein kinase domain-containing protein n=1 Tax=Sporothrix epigloea TaxID=1892477 RepID=A0ABP0DZX3_9PEZI